LVMTKQCQWQFFRQKMTEIYNYRLTDEVITNMIWAWILVIFRMNDERD